MRSAALPLRPAFTPALSGRLCVIFCFALRAANVVTDAVARRS